MSTLDLLSKQKTAAEVLSGVQAKASAAMGVPTVEIATGIDGDLEYPVADAAPPETAAPKKVAKGKKGPAAKDFEGDLIVQTANEIENVKDSATAIKHLHELEGQQGFADFKMGGYLALIQSKAWFGDHPTFKAFVENETTIEYRKALYLIGIYDGLIAADIPWEKVAGVGWTKLKELVAVLTQDNVDAWVEKAKTMTFFQLLSEVQAAKKGDVQAPEGVQAEANVSTLTFKVHGDQKETINAAVDKAMGVLGTDVKTVALEHIALDYLSGAPKKKAPAAVAVTGDPSSLDPETFFVEKVAGLAIGDDATDDEAQAARMGLAVAILEAFGNVFPEIDLTVNMPAE